MKSSSPPRSQLAKLKKSIERAIPGGLPKSVAALYAKSDGLTTNAGGDEATLVGLKEMFANTFAPPRVVKRAVDAEEALASGTFVEELYSSDFEVSSKSELARANLLLRLKLLARVSGESVALAIDFYSGAKEPVVYEVNLFDQAIPLHIGFEDFVLLFERFGTRRWYYAFLDSKAARVMNINLAREFDASMAEFANDPLVPALRAQFKRGAKPNAWRSALTKPAAASSAKAVSASAGKGLALWCVTPPAIDLGKGRASAWRDSNAYLAHAITMTNKTDALNQIAQGVRKQLRAKNTKMTWAVVAVAATVFTDNEFFELISLGMPADAAYAFAKHRDWRTAQLGSLANRSKFVWKKNPAVFDVILKASEKIHADIK